MIWILANSLSQHPEATDSDGFLVNIDVPEPSVVSKVSLKDHSHDVDLFFHHHIDWRTKIIETATYAHV